MSCLRSTTSACAGKPSTRMPAPPATTCAAVTTTCGRATQPEPSTPRPQAVAVIRTTLGCARRDRGRRERAVVGRRERRHRAGDLRERVDARERAQHGARRRELVQLLQDGRLLHLGAQRGLAGQLEQDGAPRPRRGRGRVRRPRSGRPSSRAPSAAGSPPARRARTSRRCRRPTGARLRRPARRRAPATGV